MNKEPLKREIAGICARLHRKYSSALLSIDMHYIRQNFSHVKP